MTILLPILAVAFAAFCVWLTVRIVNRRERWAKWTLAATVGLPVLYVLSFGPACWLTYSGILRHRTIARVYWPFLLARIKAPYPVRYSVHWYGSIGMPERAGITVEVLALDGRSYSSGFTGGGNP